jgi:hypothetical protein
VAAAEAGENAGRHREREKPLEVANPTSLCHRCAARQYVRGRATLFVMCTALLVKYPPQPVLRMRGVPAEGLITAQTRVAVEPFPCGPTRCASSIRRRPALALRCLSDALDRDPPLNGVTWQGRHRRPGGGGSPGRSGPACRARARRLRGTSSERRRPGRVQSEPTALPASGAGRAEGPGEYRTAGEVRVHHEVRLPPPLDQEAPRRAHVLEALRPPLARPEGAARLGLAHEPRAAPPHRCVRHPAPLPLGRDHPV